MTPLLPTLLVLPNPLISAHGLRVLCRKARLGAKIHAVNSGPLDEFLVWAGVKVVLAGEDLAHGYTLDTILKMSQDRRRPFALIVLGEAVSKSFETASAKVRKNGDVEYVRASQMDGFALTLDRVIRSQEELTGGSIRIQNEVARAAQAIRENQKIVTIGRLTASIAHEINNPLESISNLLYLMSLDLNMSSESRNYLDIAQNELGRVVQISKQTLNFYKESPSPIKTSVKMLMEEVLTLYRRRIADMDLQIERQYRGDDQITVYPGEIRQVLSNLISNAIEASHRGGRLQVRVKPGCRGGDSQVKGLRIAVADSGSGMSKETRKKIGEPFFTTKGQRGVGLGLWITQSIVRRYGGMLQVKSTTSDLHHGTTFSLFLPMNMRQQGPMAELPLQDSGAANVLPINSAAELHKADIHVQKTGTDTSRYGHVHRRIRRV